MSAAHDLMASLRSFVASSTEQAVKAADLAMMDGAEEWLPVVHHLAEAKRAIDEFYSGPRP